MRNGKFLIVVGGPTASGKTAFAIHLARHFDTAVVSADSRQFYREMGIGTAKPTAEELAQAPHYFIDSLSVTDEYSVGDFERDALQLLESLFRDKDIAVLAGGSGLYIKALCEGLDEFPEIPLATRQAVEREYEEKGLSHLQAELRAADPVYYEAVDLQNPHRLIRALAVCRAAGRPFSSFRSQEKAERLFTPIYLQLHRPRPELYARIDSRVKQMMERGLAEEARRLYPQRHHTALQTVGYQELFAHFDGLCSLEEAVALIQRNSRRYAKRQLTWYRRDGHWKLLRPDDGPLALEYIEAARNKGWRLQYSDERPEGFPFHPIAKVPGQYLQMLQREKPIAALYRAEHRQAVVIQGPFPAGGPAEALAMQLLLHEALLPGEGLPAYAIANPLHLHLPAGFRQEATSLELLPGWAQAAAGALLEALPGLGAVKVTEAG